MQLGGSLSSHTHTRESSLQDKGGLMEDLRETEPLVIVMVCQCLSSQSFITIGQKTKWNIYTPTDWLTNIFAL